MSEQEQTSGPMAREKKEDEKTYDVSCDQESWIKDRIRHAIRVGIQIEKTRGVRADNRAIEDGIEGVVNGAAIEILYTLNLRTEGENLDLRHNRDSRILGVEGDDE